MAELKFVHIGMGHLVQANRIMAVVKPSTMSTRRLLDGARKRGDFIDATMGRVLRTYLIMDDGSMIATILSPRTMKARLNGDVKSDFDGTEDVEDEVGMEDETAESDGDDFESDDA